MKAFSLKGAVKNTAQYTKEILSDALVDNPLVSVCLVTYNHAEFAAQALESVLSQQVDFSYEIVIGDDASTDATGAIIRGFQKQHPDKVTVYESTENLGKALGGTFHLNFLRNLGSCRGKYVAFLEGDDYWTDVSKLQRQIDALEKNDQLSGACHDTDALDSETGELSPWRDSQDKYFTLENTIAIQSPFHTSSFVARRECFEDLPEMCLWVKSFDMMLFILAAAKGEIERIPATMSVYRKHGEGITNTSSHDGMQLHMQRFEMMHALAKYIAPQGEVYFDRVKREHWSAVKRSMISGSHSHCKWEHLPWILKLQMSCEVIAARVLITLRGGVSAICPSSIKQWVRHRGKSS